MSYSQLLGLVVWTTDASFSSAWQSHVDKMPPSHQSNLLHFGIYFSYLEQEKQGQDEVTHQVGSGSKDYYQLMNLRGSFFVHLLEQVQTEFLFLDADMVFFRDPFPWITANQGLGLGASIEKSLDDLEYIKSNPFFYSMMILTRATNIGEKRIRLDFTTWKDEEIKEKQKSLWNLYGLLKQDYKYMGFNNPEWVKDYLTFGNQEQELMARIKETTSYYQNVNLIKELANQDPFLDIVPDIVYGSDPSDTPQFNSDPFQGQLKVPKICGGTFYVKPNNRTIMLFKQLWHEIKQGGNDQWSMDVLLNRLDAVLVGQLPKCTARTGSGRAFCPEKGQTNPDPSSNLPSFPLNDSTIRVRLLEYWQFCTSSIFYSQDTSNRHEKAFKYYTMIQNTTLVDDHNTTTLLAQGGGSFVPYQIAVAYHSNAWDRDKQVSMKSAGVWYLDDDLKCRL